MADVQTTSIPQKFFTPDHTRLSPLAYLFLILLCTAFFLPGIVTLPPTDRDEASFAQATKQMVETGNYVDIRLQEKPRYKKPIGIYWLQAASVKLFNSHHLDEIWAYRIPSFVSATIAVLMTAALGSLLFGPVTGLIAAMMMAGCAILNFEARLAKTDATLLATIMVAQYALARAYMNMRMSWRIALLFWTALGAGILIKGPIILLVLFSTLLWLRFSEKNLKWFASLKPCVGIPYLLLLVAPWFIAILTESHGAFLQQAAGNDMLAKLWQGQNHGMLPPGMHLLVFPFVFFPFALLAFFAAPAAWASRAQPAVRFCLGWIIPTWIVFEISLTKLPHYVLPTYPAIAMLAAKMLTEDIPLFSGRVWRILLALSVALFLIIGTAGAVIGGFLPYLTDHVWNYPQLVAGLLLVLAQSFSLLLFLQRQKIESVIVLTAGMLAYVVCFFGSTLPNNQHLWMSRLLTQMATAAAPCDKPQIISLSYGEPSLVFLSGTDTHITVDVNAAANEMRKNHCLIAAVDDEHNQPFLDAFAHAKQKPQMIGQAEGFNLGKGHEADITLYTMPPRSKKP